MNFSKSDLIKVSLLATFSLAIVVFSTTCLERDGHCIMPIYVMLLSGLGVPPAVFALVVAALVWFSLGIFSAKISSYIVSFFNVATTLIGGWWLFGSKEIAMTYSSVAFYGLSIALFVVIQSSCWFWGFKLKTTSKVRYTRAILTIFITLNLSWTFVTSFGIH
ncbi:hypothetical protein ACLWBD_12805 [Bdellovibrio sp. HCB117]|uniref:hypothetical protein n=1 Tax=Bdellovibrio sp. HCB117 TaxID=3394359 RepID=UPI0039B575A9